MRALVTAWAVIAAARPVAADPDGARVLTTPTAWLPRAGAATATLGIDHRGDGTAIASYGLGGLSEVELDADTDVRGCTDCTMRPVPVRLGRAAFRIGVRQGAWLTGMPALVLGVRATFAAYEPAVRDPRVTDAYAAATARRDRAPSADVSAIDPARRHRLGARARRPDRAEAALVARGRRPLSGFLVGVGRARGARAPGRGPGREHGHGPGQRDRPAMSRVTPADGAIAGRGA
jgi:hypothetical protein